ncbi:glutamate-5-semialdehyde dehydrogenase [Savitreella phatthalungensis]
MSAIAASARAASYELASLPCERRVATLKALHALLVASKAEVLAANKRDVEAAAAAGLSSSLQSRLDLTRPGKYDDMCVGVLDVANLPDLVGKCTEKRELDDGLVLRRVLCPIGVLLVIFEARPEVIVNITALALKSGNAAILKGGKESTESFRALAQVVKRALEQENLPSGAIELVETRADVADLLAQEDDIDLVIPRGSNALVRSIKDMTKINVMGHADGICHAFVDKAASLETAIKVVVDSKVNYPAACNAVETLLIHQDRLDFLQPIVEALRAAGVTCKLHRDLARDELDVEVATDADFGFEHLSLTISIASISSLDEAAAFINRNGSHHTDVIVTEDKDAARKFQRSVDSASVFVNCSTRFADGFRFGLGTEVGIATGKLHARGPVGLEGLATYKWLLEGHGQACGEYGSGGRSFTHRTLEVETADRLQ